MKKTKYLALFLWALISSLITIQAQDINLTGYTLTFAEEFNTLSVSTTSPKGGATWFYWPPYGAAGGFSASQWDVNAFSVTGGILANRAWLDSSSAWHSGNLTSMDPTGAGFAQQYGYFEIRCQMPNSGTGAWPAFWLLGTPSIPSNSNKCLEIDVFEWYGSTHDDATGLIQQASHNWNGDGTQTGGFYSPYTPMPNGAQPWQGYHIYGVLVDPTHITWYVDGVQTNQTDTPASYITPMYLMVDYALGGGWPLTGMVNNSTLNVDWVRVYSLPVATPPTTTPATISINLAGTNTAQQLQATDTAGAPGYAAANWNVFTGATKTTSSVLKDASGSTASGVILSSFASASAYLINSGTNLTANQKLFAGEILAYYAGSPAVTVSSIPYASYDVVVYIEADVAGRTGSVSLSGSSTTYYYSTIGGASQPASYVQATSTTSGTYSTGNYVVFANQTGASKTISLSPSNWSGICGIQIVPRTATTPTTVSVNLAGTNTAQQLQVTDTAGAPGYEAANWNVFTGATKTTSSVLKDASGSTASGVILSSFASASAYLINSGTNLTANQKLFAGEILAYYAGSPAVTVSSIPYASYDVVVYVEADLAGRTGSVSLSGSSTTYYYSTIGGASQPASYVQATSTTSGTYSTGNYVVFANQTGASKTISLSPSNWSGICGVQIRGR